MCPYQDNHLEASAPDFIYSIQYNFSNYYILDILNYFSIIIYPLNLCCNALYTLTLHIMYTYSNTAHVIIIITSIFFMGFIFYLYVIYDKHEVLYSKIYRIVLAVFPSYA